MINDKVEFENFLRAFGVGVVVGHDKLSLLVGVLLGRTLDIVLSR